MRKADLRHLLSAAFASVLAVAGMACTAAESRTPEPKAAETVSQPAEPKKTASIKIEPNGPADTVRVFYGHLREKRFRQAIYLTNLRPAIEQLSDRELKEYEVDLAAIARQVPSEVQINGEIISGESATVTAKLPGEDPEQSDLQELRLRKEKGTWVILAVDDYAEKRIKETGKNYLKMLRIETHQDEAKSMLDRIAKAQMAYAAQNGGKFADVRTLIGNGLLPDDALSSETTGYVYAVNVAPDATKYYATATPAEYGKSGLMSFSVRLSEKGSPLLSSKDTGGKPMPEQN